MQQKCTIGCEVKKINVLCKEFVIVWFLGPSEGFEPGVSPSKRLCDVSPLNCSPDVPCESVHLNFDDDNHLNEYPISSAASDTSSTSSSSSATPMLLGEMQRHPLPVYRSKFTPPRSPLAGPSTTQNHSRTIATSTSCFTFAPVRDWWVLKPRGNYLIFYLFIYLFAKWQMHKQWISHEVNTTQQNTLIKVFLV